MKTNTETYWDDRAEHIEKEIDVNMNDIFQRELEYDFVCQHLIEEMSILEAGCGNGFSTALFRMLVKSVDAFDNSENMIRRAKHKYGEKNNRFICDDVLSPKIITGVYDAVLCIRVLINLHSLEQQKRAISNLALFVRPGGLLILIEGFKDGYVNLDKLREKAVLPPLEPNRINLYSSIIDLLPTVGEIFSIEDRFHSGMYDFLTRLFFPLVAGADKVRHNTAFSEKSMKATRAYNPDCFESFSRVRGFALRKRQVR